jgi:hypothetical protein
MSDGRGAGEREELYIPGDDGPRHPDDPAPADQAPVGQGRQEGERALHPEEQPPAGVVAGRAGMPASGLPPEPPSAPSPFASMSSGPRAVVARAFDALLHAGPELRRGSFYAGFVALGTVAPAVLLFMSLLALGLDGELEDLESLLLAIGDAFSLAIGITTIVALLGLVVLSVESGAMASTLLGARLEGRPLDARAALLRSRMSFWRLVRAAVIVAIPLIVAQALLGELLMLAVGEELAPQVPLDALAVIVIGVPFAYYIAGIVLGDVGARTAVVRSVRLFRARPRTALVVAVFAALAGLLPIVALGAGLDLVVRVYELLAGLIQEGGPSDEARTALVALITVAVVFAVGTLIFTVQALAVAPQVVAFLALTHATPGLRHVRPAPREAEPGSAPAVPARAPRARWLTWPMAIGVIAAWLSLAAGLAALPAA